MNYNFQNLPMGTAPLGVFNVRYLSLVCILIVLSLITLPVFHCCNIISYSKQTQQVRMYNFILFRWARMQDPKCRHVSVSKKAFVCVAFNCYK